MRLLVFMILGFGSLSHADDISRLVCRDDLQTQFDQMQDNSEAKEVKRCRLEFLKASKKTECKSEDRIQFMVVCGSKKSPAREYCCKNDREEQKKQMLQFIMEVTPEEFGLPTGKPKPGPRPPENELNKPEAPPSYDI